MTEKQMFKKLRDILEQKQIAYRFESSSANDYWLSFHACSFLSLKNGVLKYGPTTITQQNFEKYVRTFNHFWFPLKTSIRSAIFVERIDVLFQIKLHIEEYTKNVKDSQKKYTNGKSNAYIYVFYPLWFYRCNWYNINTSFWIS